MNQLSSLPWFRFLYPGSKAKCFSISFPNGVGSYGALPLTDGLPVALFILIEEFELEALSSCDKSRNQPSPYSEIYISDLGRTFADVDRS